MDYKARDILAALKNVNLSVDAKVTHLLGLKSDIKQKNVPEKAVPVIFECLRHAIASPFHALYSAGFSTLGHFLKRLYIQEHHQLVAAMSDRILPALVDRMGDNKDRVRQQTTHALADLWEGAGPQIESLVLSVGFQGKNPFQKQTCLNLLSIALTRSEITAAYAEATARGYLPQIINFVEDADPTVRQGARGLLVQMFIGERDDSKHDLKRALEQHKVRPSHAREILAGIGLDPDLYDENHSSRQHSIQQRAPSRAATASRAPSRAGISRAPSRAALSRAASRADISRAPSRADTFNERPGPSISHIDSNSTVDDDAPVLHHPRPLRTSPIAGDMITASDNRIPVADSIPANDFDSLYSHDHVTVTQAVSGSATGVGRPVSVISTHAEQIVQGSTENEPRIMNTAPKQKNTVRTNASKASGIVNAPAGHTPAPASLHAVEKAKRVVEPLDIEPYDLSSSQELDRLQATMAPWFDGRETEMNFLRREEYTILIRRITHGNAPQRWPTAYFGFVKMTLPFVFVTANSVRTSLQTAGLRTVQSLARVNKERLDSSIHIVLQNVLKLCANAKGITSQNSNLTVIAILENVTCNQRVLNQITGAAKDKNQNMRIFSAGWLEIIIDGQNRHKTHADGVNSIAACIQEGVEDAKEDIRRAYRHTFFRFSSVWPARAKK
ncbi:clasp N terminal-domain-containing protein [Aspergillus similis]